MADFRIGIDLGGTKIEIAALSADGREHLRHRVPTPRDYRGIIEQIDALVREAEGTLSGSASVGVGIPGSISPATGLVRNGNSVMLNGNPLDRDLSAKLGREVRVANDANCFALSEAVDGAGAGASVVFGVIIGTGCGGGVVVDGKLINGHLGIAVEWGHNPLPWPAPAELPGPLCWCGRHNCLDQLVSGTGLAADCDGPGARDASGIPASAAAGEAQAQAALERHADRLARGLAHICNIIDPDVIVLGGGLSNMDHLYVRVPELIERYVFSDFFTTPLRRNVHGDSSGVRGAAWLWPASASGA